RRGVVRAGPGEAAHVHQLRDPGPGEEVGELVPLQAPVAHRQQGARRRVRGHDVLPNSRRDAGSNSSSFPHEVHESTAASGLNASTPNRLAALLLITTRRDRNQPWPQWEQVTVRSPATAQNGSGAAIIAPASRRSRAHGPPCSWPAPPGAGTAPS